MADQQVSTNNQVIRFRTDFAREYVRRNRLAPYAGTGMDNPICVKRDTGPTIRHPLLTRLTGSGVSGSDTLRGKGESIGNYSWDTNPTYYRHAVEFNKEDAEKTDIQLMTQARPFLLEWAMAVTRDHQLSALGAIYNGTTYSSYADAAEAAKDTWQTNNSDRVIYGANIALTGDDSAELGGVDSTNDKFTYSRLRDMRRLAENADPHITPMSTDQESEVFLVLAGQVAFRDFRASLDTIHSNADVRGMGNVTRGNNILARDGDLFFEGCIIRKVPEITSMYSATGKPLATAGASSIKVEPVFLCGAQALMWGLTQRPSVTRDTWDFGFKNGVGVELKHDIKKAFFNNVQHGVVTGYFSGAA